MPQLARSIPLAGTLPTLQEKLTIAVPLVVLTMGVRAVGSFPAVSILVELTQCDLPRAGWRQVRLRTMRKDSRATR